MSDRTTQAVLAALVAEDRPWTVEEVIREFGDRVAAIDAIAELHAAGLINKINKRVVCASRAALRAGELEF